MVMPSFIADLAQRLAEDAEAVCQHYLSNGQRVGQYWLVGDARNAPGRSLYVRLAGSAASRGRAGKWTDAATGEHGDLFDIIRESCGLTTISDVADEARRFLSLPRPPLIAETRRSMSSARIGSPESARRLFAMAQPIKGTIVETYLRNRGLIQVSTLPGLRFHPRCYSRSEPQCLTEARPAMIAAVTDLKGAITGVQRTWLDPSGTEKARIAEPRRAIGDMLGHAVRFGQAHDVLGVGEGIETTLSIRDALPGLPVAAALSAAHLASILLPPKLRRLYILRDNDPAGIAAVRKLTDRAHSAGIEAIELVPQLGDFNDDLRAFGTEALPATLRSQIAPTDVARLMTLGTERAGKE
jgi:nucleotide-binding universal stress UspA family protein